MEIYTDEFKSKAKPSHTKPLTPDEQEQVLLLRARGIRGKTICKQLKRSPTALSWTLSNIPEFKARWDQIVRAQVSEVEHSLLKMCLGGAIKTEETWVAIVDRNGTLIRDTKTGKQRMRLQTRKITRTPPPLEAMIFFLRVHAKDVYGKAAEGHGDFMAEVNGDELRHKIMMAMKLQSAQKQAD